MRLLHVISGMDPKTGGVCQAVRTIAGSLVPMGIHNEILTLDVPYAPFLQSDVYAIHAIGPGKGPWSYNSDLIPWLLTNLSRFDSVIVHGLWLYQSYAVRKALHRVKSRQILDGNINSVPKYYIMPHGMLDPYFQLAPGRRFKSIRNSVYWKLIEASVINQADAILFTCQEERRLACKPFHPYRPKREEVVGLGVEQPPLYHAAMREAFDKQCFEIGNHAYILFLSRIDEKKGVDLLIKTYAKLRATRSEATVVEALPKLVIAGPGLDTPYGQEMQRLVAESPELETAVHFVGMLAGDAKWGAFYGCDAFILPSHQENFGIAVVEALACGKPVLISNQVNIWQEIEAAGGGIVADDTLSGTQHLLSGWANLSAQDKANMKQQARELFLNKFITSCAASQLLSVLSKGAHNRLSDVKEIA